MMKILATIYLGLVLVPGISLAGLSPVRVPGKTYQEYLNKTVSSSYQSNLDKSEITEWPSLQTLKDFFWATRDQRDLVDSLDFNRRISWLYPDNGCFARAALIIQKAKEWNLPLPNRIFLYGNLSVKTPHSPEGYVKWWYHTAPVVKVDGEFFVLDASIDHLNPLPLQSWIDVQISEDSQNHEVQFCQPYTYDPNDSCAHAKLDTYPRGFSEIQTFLKLEWSRQLELGRNPSRVLGDEPPWVQTSISNIRSF